MSGRVLVVDDERDMCEFLEAGLRKRGFAVTWRTTGQEALELASAEAFDAVVTDLNMRGMNGLELCQQLAEGQPDVPVIVITAFGSLDTATAAIRAGAYDFITKPFELDSLKLTLERALRHRALRQEVRRLRRAVDDRQGWGEMLGDSPGMKRVFDLLDRVADSDTAVLLAGARGTGKELAARALHRHSRRAGGPFVSVACAAVPESLLEGELLGHAAVGSVKARPSVFQRAAGGTVFLDEIGDLTPGLQAKLLHALQEGPPGVGGAAEPAAPGVRLVTATQRDIETAVEESRFREDLYYALNVVRVDLPPLRSRGADVLLLGQSFVQQFAASKGKSVEGLAAGAADKLMSYAWPGNVRELRNCIERAVTLTRYDQITAEDLPEKIRAQQAVSAPDSDDPAELLAMDEVERRYIARVLEATGGNKTQAAQILGFDRATLYRKLERYGIRGGPVSGGPANG